MYYINVYIYIYIYMIYVDIYMGSWRKEARALLRPARGRPRTPKPQTVNPNIRIPNPETRNIKCSIFSGKYIKY